MGLTDRTPLTFERGPLVPAAAYLVVIGVLSALVFVSPAASPPPVLGMAWGVFLVGLAIGAFTVEGVSQRRVLPSARALVSVSGVLAAFWALYNLVAVALALGGVVGFEAAWSRAAARPLPYLAALSSSLLFTAIPEELFFRAYLQQRLVAMAGGDTRRTVVAGVAAAALLFAVFHLPRWVLASGHGVGTALVVRFAGLTLAGLAYGLVYAVTGNLWLVALCHATMNYPPLLVSVHVPAELHLVAGAVEYAALVSVVYLAVRVLDPDRPAPVWSRKGFAS
ncbi:CPBP family glutamic-type intramembrane protease [Haloarcula sp. S1CR25-12]|uniref:CPBP family glutamic-type intramembrane protease n=1 Tax=Haloarcula saliterrae TaxID=2950534 RepID=A0ABU2FDE0_9EURY|nr:CPBP family glutamic-type intramembrane protease [Haloarcula sp. S1CR25-12]MDS0260280.1 CPBP family glutamic-type intramembrane protease [Haloarcula sp. S1CR25-12]